MRQAHADCTGAPNNRKTTVQMSQIMRMFWIMSTADRHIPGAVETLALQAAIDALAPFGGIIRVRGIHSGLRVPPGVTLDLRGATPGDTQVMHSYFEGDGYEGASGLGGCQLGGGHVIFDGPEQAGLSVERRA